MVNYDVCPTIVARVSSAMQSTKQILDKKFCSLQFACSYKKCYVTKSFRMDISSVPDRHPASRSLSPRNVRRAISPSAGSRNRDAAGPRRSIRGYVLMPTTCPLRHVSRAAARREQYIARYIFENERDLTFRGSPASWKRDRRNLNRRTGSRGARLVEGRTFYRRFDFGIFCVRRPFGIQHGLGAVGVESGGYDEVPPQIGRSKEMVGPRCVRFRIGFVGDRPEARPCRHSALSYKGRSTTEKTEEDNTEIKDSKNDAADSVYHMKQYISNACGTIALLHSVANNLDIIQLEDGFLKKFLDETKGLSYTERGEHLEKAQGIIDTHMESAQEGQTEAPVEDLEVYHHFVAFVHKDGSLYELDGRKPAPINHGLTTPEELLDDAARVCKEYMERDPNEVRFTVVALAANE